MYIKTHFASQMTMHASYDKTTHSLQTRCTYINKYKCMYIRIILYMAETIIIFIIDLPLCQTIHKIDLTFMVTHSPPNTVYAVIFEGCKFCGFRCRAQNFNPRKEAVA